MRIIFWRCLVLLMFTRCDIGKHMYYIQPTQNVPLFKAKNDFRFSGDFSGGEGTTSGNVNAALSITNKFALTANYNAFSNKSGSSQNGVTSNNYNAKTFEMAFGYYKPHLKFGVFEVYGGIGWLGQNHKYTEDSIYYTISNWGWLGTYTNVHSVWLNRGSSYLGAIKYFVQAQYGFTSKYLEAAISIRYSNLYFSIVDNKVNKRFTSAYNEVEQFRKYRNYLMMEPALTIRAGWQYFKFQFQMSYSEPLTNNFRFVSQSISFGIYIKISNLKAAKNEYKVPIPQN